MKNKLIIAIDPDTEKSGVAMLLPNGQIVTKSLSFSGIMKLVPLIERIAESHGDRIEVYVEAGWLNAKPNFHGKNGRVGEKIASAVGANWQTGKIIIEMLEYYGIKAVPVKPYRKVWKGRDGKITHAELASIKGITLVEKRTNQDERDAALIAIYKSNMPIIIGMQYKS